MATASKKNIDNDIIDINLSAIKKKRIRINGDNSMILELNTSDMGIVSRLHEAYPKLVTLQQSIEELPDEETDDVVEQVSKILVDIDKQMRDYVDFIFGAAVSEVCAKDGSMYDPLDGMFRFEHIIDALSNVYEESFNTEFTKMRNRVDKYSTK